MKIGVCKLQLRVPENDSLKGKRRVLKSIMARAASKYNISIAEIEDQELWQMATLGFSCVGNDASFVNEVLSRVVNFVERSRGDTEIVDYQTEIADIL